MPPIEHPTEQDFRLERVLYALSDPVRLSMLRHLGVHGAATCVALSGDRPKSTMSHHFRVLRECGLIVTRCEGPTHINELRREELDRRFPGVLAAILAAE